MVPGTSRTPDRILKTALELFAAKGYDATSVREICEASGVAKPTLYHFYGSKEGVYRALVVGALGRFRADVAELLETGAARERLGRLARRYFETARDNQELLRFLLSRIFSSASSAPDPKDIHGFYADVRARLVQVVDEGVREGEFAPGPTDVRLLVLMGALGECLHGSLLTGRPALEPELADALLDSILEGWTERR